METNTRLGNTLTLGEISQVSGISCERKRSYLNLIASDFSKGTNSNRIARVPQTGKYVTPSHAPLTLDIPLSFFPRGSLGAHDVIHHSSLCEIGGKGRRSVSWINLCRF